MVAQGHPANCFSSDGGVDFAASTLNHLDLQVLWAERRAHSTQGPHSSSGGGTYLYMGPWKTFQILASAPQLQRDRGARLSQIFSSPNYIQKKGTVITWLWETPNPIMLRKDFKYHSFPKYSLKVWARLTWLKIVINGRIFLIQAQTCQNQMSNFKLVTSQYAFF